MSRKVFISVLGTGFYEECVYGNDVFKAHDTRFIQRATLEMLKAGGEWSQNDVAYILLTCKAKSSNWQVEGNKRKRILYSKEGQEEKEEEYIGLKDKLADLQLPFEIESVDIPKGRNEQEIWEVFDKTYALLQEGDEVYFDITHAFRYLPMLILVLCNYAKFLKNVKVKAITYGNYEARGKVAPIMDLTSFSALQDWTFSGASFTEMGKFRNLTDSLSSISGNVNGKLQNSIKQLNIKLNEWEGQIATCRGSEIMHGKSLKEAKNLIKKISANKDVPQPLTNILKKIEKIVVEFPEDGVSRLCYAICWCKQYNMVQQGYTLCQESIITYLCTKFEDKNPYKQEDGKRGKKYREFWSSLLWINSDAKKDETKWGKNLAENRELARALFKLDWVEKLGSKCSNLVKNRNQVNHAGFVGVVNSEEIISQFKKCADDCLEFLGQENLEWPQVICNKDKKLFINLSNHPSSNWSEEQQAAARAYGEIKNWDFPSVPPHANEDEIDGMAKERVSRILEKTADADVTVHVMGEMSLTFRIVQLLKSHGIRCLCSTTQRMVAEQDGRKVTEFHFEQFREY